MDAPRKAKILVQEGLLHDVKLNDYMLFVEDCILLCASNATNMSTLTRCATVGKSVIFVLENKISEAAPSLRPPQVTVATTTIASTLYSQGFILYRLHK